MCPVYGSGVLVVLSVLNILGTAFGVETDLEKASPLLLFVVGLIFATLIELIAGFLLDKLFHARWWDYRDRKFNLNGYICLGFSIVWGLAIAFVLRVIQPFFDHLIDLIPVFLGWIVLIFVYIMFITDIVITVMTILKLNKQLEHMQKMEAAMLRVSDGMSEVIATNTMKTMDRLEESRQKSEERKEAFREKAEERKENLREKAEERRKEREEKRAALEEQYIHLKKQIEYHKLFGAGMVLNNFAENGHSRYQDIISKIRDNK